MTLSEYRPIAVAAAFILSGCRTLPMPETLSARTAPRESPSHSVLLSLPYYRAHLDACCAETFGEAREYNEAYATPAYRLAKGLPLKGLELSGTFAPGSLAGRLKYQAVGAGQSHGAALAAFGETGLSFPRQGLWGALGLVGTLGSGRPDLSLGGRIGALRLDGRSQYPAQGPEEEPALDFNEVPNYRNHGSGSVEGIEPGSHAFADLFLDLRWRSFNLGLLCRQLLPSSSDYPDTPRTGKHVLWHFTPVVAANLGVHF